MKTFNKRKSLLLDRATVYRERGGWFGRLFKRLAEWYAMGGRL